MKNKIRLENGFSLMEMMVVLLIISIIMAATAPMVAKKMATDRANGGSPWIFTSNNGNIGFNIAGNNVSAIIGASEISGRPNGITPRLIINGSNAQPALAFASGGNYAGQLTVDGSIGAVGISNSTIPDHSVALGMNQTVNTEETVTIGFGAATTDVGAIAIGSGASSAHLGVALNGNAAGNRSVAIGHGANAENDGAININNKITYSGTEAGNRTITLGSNNDLVNIPGTLRVNNLEIQNLTIPGNLVVAGSAYLGTGNTSRVFLRANRAGDEADNRFSMIWHQRGAILYLGDGMNQNQIQSSINYRSSDARLKNIGTKYVAGLEELKKLDFFHYTFKSDNDKTPQVGVIAQDLQKVFPTAVATGEDGYLRIRWDEMFYAVINAVKELDARLTEFAEQAKLYFDETMALKVTVGEQQKTIQEQQKTIEALKMEIKTQNTEFEKRLGKIEKRQNAD